MNLMMNRAVLTAMLAFIHLLCFQGTNAQSVLGSRKILYSVEDPISSALTFLGFKIELRDQSVEKNIKTQLLSPDEFQYILNGKIIKEHNVWHVTIKGLEYPQKLDSIMVKQKPRDFEVWLDAVKGKLIRIYSPIPNSSLLTKHKPFYQNMEKRMMSDTNIVYTSLPDSMPQLKLRDVLDIAVAEPFNKGEIVAYYMNESRYGSPPRAVWIIDIGGLPPIDSSGSRGSTQDYNENHSEKIIDANNGEVIMFTFYTARNWWQCESDIQK